MTRLLAIARREWAGYFRTPAGWAVLALFLLLQGIVFWMFVQFLGRPDAPPGGVMEFFFGGTILFWIALGLLATVVPMRLIAEELRTGTIEPLLTAPVSPGEVVVGKWLAALGFYLAAWAPTLLYLLYLSRVGAVLEPGPIVAGYLGTVLIGAAALAIGLLASALTRNQLVAATLSFVGFLAALLAGALEASVRAPGVAAALRRYSLFRVMEDFGHGIVDSRPVALLLTVVVLALAAATVRVTGLRGPVPLDLPATRRWSPRLAAILIVAIALMTNAIAARRYVRGDWTRASLYALSEETENVLRELPRPVTATIFLYPKRDSERARAIAGFVRELTERFTRASAGKFQAEIVDPDRAPDRAEAAAKRYGIGAYEMGQGVVIFTSGARSKVITEEDLVEPEVDADGEPGPTIHAWRGEAAFVSALLAVTDDQPPLVCFSKGHGEPDLASLEDGGYATFAENVRRDGDETRALDKLADAAGAGCRVLVIAEPTRAFSQPEIAAVDSFVDAGGRLLVMTGPVFAAGGAAFAHVGLEALATRYGVTLDDNLVVDPSHASDVEGPSVWAAGRDSYLPHPITARFGGRLTFWPRTRQVAPAPLRSAPPGLTVTPLVRTSADGWGETDLPTIRGDADLTFDAAVDRHGPVTVAVAVERAASAAAPATRLAFLGTGRLVMNYRLSGVTLRDYDADFVLSTIAWLADRDARIGIGPKITRRVALSLTAADVSWAFRLFVIGLPLLALAAGVWIARRRRI
ncbi:MAG TPA: Gldg family protein [Polyangia bacterium]|nr:Gldg family protein [Polyangia bacterium]